MLFDVSSRNFRDAECCLFCSHCGGIWPATHFLKCLLYGKVCEETTVCNSFDLRIQEEEE